MFAKKSKIAPSNEKAGTVSAPSGKRRVKKTRECIGEDGFSCMLSEGRMQMKKVD